MRVNLKTGFNRLFVVAALGWSVYVLWYVPVEQWHTRFDLVSDKWKLCLSTAARDGNRVGVERCNKQHEEDVRQIPSTAWAGIGWGGWTHLIVLLCSQL